MKSASQRAFEGLYVAAELRAQGATWNTIAQYLGRHKRVLNQIETLGTCARQSLGKGDRCTKHSETFRSNSEGNQSLPAKLSQQPEASLASCPGNRRGEA